MDQTQDLKAKINKIIERNNKVEMDKAWETSYTRKIAICIITYIAISIFFIYTGANNPFISAIVPSIGFILSTLSIDILKSFWKKHIYKE